MSKLQTQIIEFLKGNLSYYEGIALFSQVGGEPSIVRNLRSAETQLRAEILRHELSKHLTDAQLCKSQKNEAGKTTTSSCAGPISHSSETNVLPQYHSPSSGSNRNHILLGKVANERKEAYRKRAFLHTQLWEATSDKKRYELAKQIMLEMKPLIDRLNRDYHSLLAGDVPAGLIKRERSASEFVQIRNLKTYISRYTKRIAGGGTATHIKKRNILLDQYETELNECYAREPSINPG